MEERKTVLDFGIQYWPAIVWLVIGIVGMIAIVVPLINPRFTALASTGIIFLPLALIRHIQMNAFFRLNVRAFNYSQARYGQDRYGRVFQANIPMPGCFDAIFNFLFNIVLSFFAALFSYPFREAFAQGKFLIRASTAWRNGQVLEAKSAKWGRATG